MNPTVKGPKRPSRTLLTGLAGLLLGLAAVAAAPAEPNWPDYEPVEGLSGQVQCLSTAWTIQLAGQWAEAFGKMYRQVQVRVDHSDAAGAFEALLAGRVPVVLLGQPLTDEQAEAFRKKHGYRPMRLDVARDAIAIYVHRDNPVRGLSLQQLDAVFSSTRKRGGPAVQRWSDLGVDSEPWSGRPVDRIYGLGPGSGLYEVFTAQVLQGGRFNPAMHVEPGPSSVVNAVGAYRQAIGFSHHHYRSRRVRPVAIAQRPGGPFVLPTLQTCLAGRYPLMRAMSAYVNVGPGRPVGPVVGQWLKFICSAPGQAIVQDLGDIPIDPAQARRQIQALR